MLVRFMKVAVNVAREVGKCVKCDEEEDESTGGSENSLNRGLLVASGDRNADGRAGRLRVDFVTGLGLAPNALLKLATGARINYSLSAVAGYYPLTPCAAIYHMPSGKEKY